MVLINYTVREISAKIVYYGPGLSGKTTNLQIIHGRITPENRGKLVSLATETDRTLFFDFFPVDFGTIGGFKVRFHFYTVPGQVFYNSTRKLVLKGTDGVVFVADSQKAMADSNVESLLNLKENLAEIGIDLNDFPFVLQYNKRDMDDILTIGELEKDLNPNCVPYYEACALKGTGIMETMKAVSKIALKKISDQKGIGPKRAAAKPAAAKPAPEISATQKVKEAIKAAKEDKDLGAPATPPPVKAAKPAEAKPVAAKPAPAKPAEVKPAILTLDALGKASISDIILHEGMSSEGNGHLSLPLIVKVPSNIGASKLHIDLSASFTNEAGELIKPAEEKKAKKRGWLFGKKK